MTRWLASSSCVSSSDRGFKRVEITRHLHGLDFVIRTGGNVHVRSATYNGCMQKLVTRRGQWRDLTSAVLRPSRPVTVRVVGYWAPRAKEPWLLMTNLDVAPA